MEKEIKFKVGDKVTIRVLDSLSDIKDAADFSEYSKREHSYYKRTLNETGEIYSIRRSGHIEIYFEQFHKFFSYEVTSIELSYEDKKIIDI